MSKKATKPLDLIRHICENCSLTIKSKNFIQCATCTRILDLKCAYMTTKKYNSMTKANKEKWKCRKCTMEDLKATSCFQKSIQSNNDSSSPIKLQNNDTLKNISNKSLHQSLENLSYDSTAENDNSSLINLSRNSLPELNNAESSEISGLRQEITELSYQLESAHEEVTKLNIENSDLKKIVEEQKKKMKIYEQLIHDGPTSNNSTPINTKKSHHKITIPGGTPIYNEISATKSKRKARKKSLSFTEKDQQGTNDMIINSSIQKTAKETDEQQERAYQYKSGINDCSSIKASSLLIETNHDKINEIQVISDDQNTTKLLETKQESLTHCDLGINESLPNNASENVQEPHSKKTIYIVGSQQCKKLSTILKHTRQNTPYEKYEVEAFIKPGASTEAILKSCKLYNYSTGDKLIISVGENDTDPMGISSELYSTLKSLPNIQILITSVQYSKFLNEYKINEILQIICNKFPNCTYLNLSNNIHQDNGLYICNRINFAIDQMYYNQNFLNFTNMRRKKIEIKTNELLCNSFNLVEKNIKKGTIPYYFKPIPAQNRKTVEPNDNQQFFRR